MADLVVDTQVLWDAGAGLRRVVTDFESAPDLIAQISPHVGHGGLAGALDDFANNWSNRRRDMVAEVQGLATIAEQAGQTYEELETALVSALVGEQ